MTSLKTFNVIYNIYNIYNAFNVIYNIKHSIHLQYYHLLTVKRNKRKT